MRAFDRVLIGPLLCLAFLLACYKLIDTDIWWHLRGGEWILQRGRVPRLDPFTFGSADRVWVDLHWIFEVLVAVAYRVGKMPAVTLLTASVTCASVAAGLAARRRPWCIAASVVCWLPALLMMSARLDPRPEIFSMLYLAAFFAALMRSSDSPRWMWFLPGVQLLWVNTQGLFVLGPIMIGFFLAGEALRDWRTGRVADRRWRHFVGASLAVIAACFVNPYFAAGARLPLELFTKISDTGSPYKSYINEFYSPLEFGRRTDYQLVRQSVYFPTLYFLLLVLAASFVVPVLWTATRDGVARSRDARRRARMASPDVWLAVMAAITCIELLGAATLPGSNLPGWLVAVGTAAGTIMIVLGMAGGLILARASWAAGLLAAAAGLGMGLAMDYLRSTMFGVLPGPLAVPGGMNLLAAAIAVAVALALRHESDFFRTGIAAAFIYLSLQAVRNLNMFGLVAGILLSENINQWLARLSAEGTMRWADIRVKWIFRLSVLGVLTTSLGIVPTDAFRRWTGDYRKFGLDESGLRFPHAAVEFAGGSELPDRALVYDIGLAALYVFHNAPEKKVFMDPRLEVPTLETFQTYVRIEQSLERQDDEWVEPLRRLGASLIALDHNQHNASEATLLARSDWRCIYFDALAAVFVSDASGVSATTHPTVDFGQRHFQERRRPSSPDHPESELYEAKWLTKVGGHLRRWKEVTWSFRIPVLLHALDRLDLAQEGRAEERTAQERTSLDEQIWTFRGQCLWNLVPDLSRPPPSSAEGWSAPSSLLWAQSTWCLRQALLRSPGYVPAVRSLYDSWRARRMLDAQIAAGEQLRKLDALLPQQQEELAALAPMVAGLAPGDVLPDSDIAALVASMIERGAGATAAELVRVRKVDVADWDWPLVDRLAAVWMHLGEPGEARKLWNVCQNAPSEAVKLSRLADAALVERQFDLARNLYRQAVEHDPKLAEAWCGLAMMSAQQGDADEAFRACGKALAGDLPILQRRDFESLSRLVAQYCGQASSPAALIDE